LVSVDITAVSAEHSNDDEEVARFDDFLAPQSKFVAVRCLFAGIQSRQFVLSDLARWNFVFRC